MNRPNWKRRAYYGVTIATMLAMTAGFALATVQLGQTNTSYQGSQTTTVSPVAGLMYSSTILAPSTNPASTTCTQGSPCSVLTSDATDCVAGTCAASDYVEEITLNTVVGTQFPGTGTISITVYVTVGGTTTTAGTTEYYTEASAPTTAHAIVQLYDIGTTTSGPSDVTSITVIAVGV